MRARFQTALAVLALLSLAGPAEAAGAERLAQIAEHIDAARFDEADAELREALASGALERRDLARVHLLAGVIASARRDESGSRASFRRALSLEPAIVLPSSAGPHVIDAFEQAKRELGDAAGLGVAAEGAQARAGSAAIVRVVVSGDSEGIARRLRVRAASFRQERPLPPFEHAIEVPAPSEGCRDVAADVLDRSGNRLWSAAAVARVCAGRPTSLATTPATSPPGDRAEERLINAPIWVGLGLTALGVAATGALGTIALDRRADYHSENSNPSASEAERQRLFDDASTAQQRATIAAIATAAIGAATLTLYLTRPRRGAPEVSVRVQSDRAAAVVGGQF